MHYVEDLAMKYGQALKKTMLKTKRVFLYMYFYFIYAFLKNIGILLQNQILKE